MRLCPTGSLYYVQAHFTSAVRDPSRLHPRTLIGINNISIRTFNCCEKLISSFDHDPHVCNWTCHEHSFMHSPTPTAKRQICCSLPINSKESRSATFCHACLCYVDVGQQSCSTLLKSSFYFILHPISNTCTNLFVPAIKVLGDVALNKAIW